MRHREGGEPFDEDLRIREKRGVFAEFFFRDGEVVFSVGIFFSVPRAESREQERKVAELVRKAGVPLFYLLCRTGKFFG